DGRRRDSAGAVAATGSRPRANNRIFLPMTTRRSRLAGRLPEGARLGPRSAGNHYNEWRDNLRHLGGPANVEMRPVEIERLVPIYTVDMRQPRVNHIGISPG